MGTIDDWYRQTHRREDYGMAGLGCVIDEPFYIWAPRNSSVLQHIYFTLSTIVCKWCLYMAEDIYWPYMEILLRVSAMRRRFSCSISQYTLQLTQNPATICHLGGIRIHRSRDEWSWAHRSWVVWSGMVFLQLRVVGSWMLTESSHAVWKYQWVGIFIWWTICHLMDYGTAMHSQWIVDSIEVSINDFWRG